MTSIKLPDIEERFLPPKNWRSGSFLNAETNHYIHYNYAALSHSKGTVIVLPGLSEFGEKYIETARFFNEQQYDFYVIDWAYQGRSSRFEDNPHKRHSDGYESDINDLNYLINNIIQLDIPLYMLAHSMGGHIGLRYLTTQKHNIKAASFSAPMVGIKNLRHFPIYLSKILKLFKSLYIPTGKNWYEKARKSDGTDIFTSDPIRDQVHNKWCLSNPDLQIGYPTFKWVYESLKSIHFMKKKDKLKKINIPVFIASAEKEALVDNKAHQSAARLIPHSKHLFLEKAKHEIMMETDDIRDNFLQETLQLFNQSN